MYTFLIVFIIFIFGLLVGSFLNAVIYRLRTKESILLERSHCPKCGKILSWYELVPVFSFLAQRGRCRACKETISWQYPAVEIATAIIFLLVIFNFQSSIFNFQFWLNSLFLWFIVAGLIVIFVYDLRHYIIPDRVLFPITIAAFLWKFLSFNNLDLIENLPVVIRNFETLFIVLVIGILTAAPFAALYFMSQGRWMGFGDVKFSFFMGVLLGWPGIILALFLAFNFGALVGIFLIIIGKKKPKNQIPFAPFLILGTLITLFWGQTIIGWYLNLIF